MHKTVVIPSKSSRYLTKGKEYPIIKFRSSVSVEVVDDEGDSIIVITQGECPHIKAPWSVERRVT